MLLKDFPIGFSLGYSVHAVSVMLQSVLIRISMMVEEPDYSLDSEDAQAIRSLSEMIEAAQRNITVLQKRISN